MNEIILKYHLQFFADSAGDKTEDATSKKLTDARDEGQVAKSTDLIIAFSLFSLFLILKMGIGYIGGMLIGSFQVIYGSIARQVEGEFNTNSLMALMRYTAIQIVMAALPIFVVTVAIALIVNLAQVKWHISLKPLKPKFDKFNPVSGMKRLFSKDKVMDLLKSIAKLVILGYVVYDALKDQWGLLVEFYEMELLSAIFVIGDMVIDLGMKISIYFLVIAFVDYFYQKRKFKKDMKMSKQEIKDEYKQSEGDPKVKGQIKNRMLQASQRRMMQALPEADVVITNPTHLAVAIRYNRDKDSAPIVIAKGADYLAEKIKLIAKENKIEVVENKPLARMLYYNVDLDAEIPQELYQMVAEILAYVYGLKQG